MRCGFGGWWVVRAGRDASGKGSGLARPTYKCWLRGFLLRVSLSEQKAKTLLGLGARRVGGTCGTDFGCAGANFS